MGLSGVWYILTRKKLLDSNAIASTKLSRCLNTGDLTALGIGSTLGVGIYVLAGHVAKEYAGPSVILSFLLAAIASVFAGLCYAEFGARVPRAGSAYIYSYVCIGEFVAFVVGWNLILEYVIGSASVSRGISLYLDTLLNDTLKETFRNIAPISVSNMSSYFDILAFVLVFVAGCGLAFGLKQSSMINNIFTVLNLIIVIFVIAAGSIKADIDNWFIPESSIEEEINGGTGGFFPFGFEGTLKGAATCFFGFVGFDCIATTGEEVQNPKKSIPIAIILSLSIIFLSYFGVSAVITLMLPYYLQDSNAPIPYAFGQVGWVWAKWIVSIGGIFGLLASLFGALFPLPRILYAMASDGLIFKIFGSVSFQYKSPIFGTIAASLLTGTMAGCFELHHLVNMMSIGTLMAYTVVAASIVVLRYKPEDDNVSVVDESNSLLISGESEEEKEQYNFLIDDKYPVGIKKMKYQNDIEIDDPDNISAHDVSNKTPKYSSKDVIRQLFNLNKHKEATRLSYTIVASLMGLFCLFCLIFGLCLSLSYDKVKDKTTWIIVLLCILGICMLFLLICVSFQPKSNKTISFKVPLVPLIPFLSIFINIYLMLMLDVVTWIRFGIWMAIGILIYLMSLCIYKRGVNYATFVQKSSVNGHMKGNLNYAFENMTECQENESIEDPEKYYAMSVSSIKEDNNDDLNNVIISKNEIPSSPKENVETVEPLTDSYGDEIIQMLDQVLQDAEDNSEEIYDGNESKDLQFENLTLSTSSIDDQLLTDNNLGNDKYSHSVEAIVHQEDDSKEPDKDEPISDISNLPVGEVKSDISNLENQNMEKSLANDQSFIPAPPPMNEELYNNTKAYIKFKAPGIDPNKKTDRIHIKVARKSSLDNDSNESLTKKELIAKLNNLYESQGKNQDLKRGISIGNRKISQPNSEVYGDYPGMYRSEPDIGSILKREKIGANLSAVTIPLDNESQTNQENGKNTIQLNPTSPNSNLTSNNSEVEKTEDDPPLKVEDIKKKLESIFSKTPKMPRSKGNKETEEGSKEITPKKIDFTNTMKLQRTRYEDVLKSFEQARNSMDSKDMPSTVSKSPTRMSIAKFDVSKSKSDDV